MTWLAEGRREHDWAIASSLMALAAELHRDRKKRRRPFKPSEFNPLNRSDPGTIPATVTQLAEILGGRLEPAIGTLKSEG